MTEVWDFENWSAGELGCEVHAYDPTTKYLRAHLAHKRDNLYFHYEGLRGELILSTSTDFLSLNYGELGGNFSTLTDMWIKNGHKEQNRNINILKIDCEGWL